jgi:tRNA(Ile)-lysidine synthase
MLDRFKNFLIEQKLCSFGDRVLLAVSGGIDSVIMAHLFHEAGVDCAIAHCNFQLRGEDSVADELFVRSLADSLEMPVYVKQFDVDELAAEKGISVQMAARELRYRWFGEIIQLQSFTVVATAHNQNDSVETMLLNLSRGTGIRGLSGIPVRNGNIIRPLLFATRKEILSYQQAGQLAYREDASNQETKYRRNKIRHDVIPVLEQINPGFISTMTGNMNRLNETFLIYRQSIDQKRKALFSEEHDSASIQISGLKSLSPLKTWLYELFSVYGFTRSQCEEIEHIMDSEPGRRSISPSHQLYKDRDRLILVKTKPDSFDRYYLDSPEKISALPFSMDLQVMERSELREIPGEASTACLDYDKIQFPLTIRHWNHGDYFFPLGMEQIKKLSDFFVDQKIPVPEKERTWILASGKEIVWIMGHRIDNRFRITDETSRVLLLRLQTDVAPQHLEESI